MFKLQIPTRLTDYLGEAVVWTVIEVTLTNWRVAAAPSVVVNFGVFRRVAEKQLAKRLPMSGRIDYSEPILLREEQELGGIGNGTSTPHQGG